MAGEPLFLPEDTALAIALTEQEAAEEAEQCPRCGLQKSVCRDISNQFGFAVSAEQCHATAAITDAMAKYGDEASAGKLVWSAYLRH